MKYECVESTLDIVLHELHGDQSESLKLLRLWVNLDGIKGVLPSFPDATREITAKAARMGTHALFEWLPTILPGLNAAQLLRQHPGNKDVRVGMMVYYVPFDGETKVPWWKWLLLKLRDMKGSPEDIVP